jgi:crossover junction endodeoxyribonuclease RuvC
MRIIGIDPGYAILGYGVVDKSPNKYTLVECGVLTTDKDLPMPERIRRVYAMLMDVIAEFGPDDAAVEELYFSGNAKTAMRVGEARGAAILACANSGLNIYEYTPLQIKQALAGYGRADKRQIQELVKRICGLREAPKPDDAADAVAAAICHGNSSGYIERVRSAVGAESGGTGPRP